MLMVIFGAGASYGSQPVTPEDDSRISRLAGRGSHGTPPRPPLTRELFSEDFAGFTEAYPASRPAIVSLRKALVRDPEILIETEIGKLYIEADADPERARHLLALRFYLADLIADQTARWWKALNGFTHYTELLEQLGRWRARTGEPVVLVTFNYDELLDRTVEAQVGNWTLDSIDSYIDRRDWRVYKLHGSTGWSRVLNVNMDGGDKPGTLIARAEELDLASGKIRASSWEDAVETHEIAVAVPGIAVPTDLKQTFECPPPHVEAFTADIPSVTKLITIGWRAAEPHVVSLLSEHLQPGYHLGICDIDADDMATITANLDLAARKAHISEFPGGFTTLLQGSGLETWLDRPIG